jgi:hypothetical protein
MFGQTNSIAALIADHFAPEDVDDLAITERRFPLRIRADVQLALDEFTTRVSVRHFSGIRNLVPAFSNLSALLASNPNFNPEPGPPQHEEIDIGEKDPVRCVKEGLWLCEDAGTPFAFLMQANSLAPQLGTQFQVAAVRDAAGSRITQKLFRHLEEAVTRARCYRGKILSLETTQPFMGMGTGIKVHRLRRVEREQVILPRPTLDLLERNVIRFVQHRPRLAELGQSTRKGLLFHGKPGTGKTHTVHYLAGALPGVTTLLVTSEQVALLHEYMQLARLLQPSLVVIEDVDLVAIHRPAAGTTGWEKLILHQLLNEMDGLREDAAILFVLTTNRPDVLEEALASRPGRIDQAIEFSLPDEEGRAKLIRLYARGMPLADDLVRATVGKTAGVSPAFLKELMRRAIQFHLERDGTGALQMQDVDSALEELLHSGGALNRRLFGFRAEQPPSAP